MKNNDEASQPVEADMVRQTTALEKRLRQLIQLNSRHTAHFGRKLAKKQAASNMSPVALWCSWVFESTERIKRLDYLRRLAQYGIPLQSEVRFFWFPIFCIQFYLQISDLTRSLSPIQDCLSRRSIANSNQVPGTAHGRVRVILSDLEIPGA